MLKLSKIGDAFMNDNNNEKNALLSETNLSNRKQINLLAIVVVFTCVILIGTSYAWLKVSNESSKNIGVIAGSLDFSFDDSGSTEISLTNSVGVSDSEGEKTNGYTFTLKNTGNITGDYYIYLDDADLSSGEQRLADKYVRYTIGKNNNFSTPRNVDDSSILLYNGTMNAGGSATFNLKVWLDDSIFDSDATSKVFKKKLRIETSQESQKLCKRATSLHTTPCTQTSSTSYCSADGYVENNKGTVITYGSLGNDGALKSGDAFDCDVNGDGVFDKNTERFYYVDDVNNSNVVLVYYSNTTNGVSDQTSSSLIAYNSDLDGVGPMTAITNLPTTKQWKLSSIGLRNIYDDSLKLALSNFSYDGYAARMLTNAEIKSACNFELAKCNYLLENTKYSSASNGTVGYWIESPDSSEPHNALYVDSSTRKRSSYYKSDKNFTGVRPAIEVSKKNISY